MEVTLVHPDDRESKVVATHPAQVAAYKGSGFVEESDLAVLDAEKAKEAEDAKVAADLKTENEKLREQLAAAEKKAEEAQKAIEDAEKAKASSKDKESK